MVAVARALTPKSARASEGGKRGQVMQVSQQGAGRPIFPLTCISINLVSGLPRYGGFESGNVARQWQSTCAIDVRKVNPLLPLRFGEVFGLGRTKSWSIAISASCLRQHGVLRQMVEKAAGNPPNLGVGRNIEALLALH